MDGKKREEFGYFVGWSVNIGPLTSLAERPLSTQSPSFRIGKADAESGPAATAHLRTFANSLACLLTDVRMR
jgi:hypothetical protein